MKKRRLIGIAFVALTFYALLFFPTKAQSVKFFYVATSVSSNGNESVFSNEVSATPTASKPHAVLSWTASTSSVAGYNVYRGTVSGGPYTKLNSSIITTLTYTDLVAFPNPPTGLTVVNDN